MLDLGWTAAIACQLHAWHAIVLDGCKCLHSGSVCAGMTMCAGCTLLTTATFVTHCQALCKQQSRDSSASPPPLPCREMLPDSTFFFKAKQVCPPGSCYAAQRHHLPAHSHHIPSL